MKDAVIVKHTIQALSPRIIAAHGPTGTGKSTVFPLAITHWSEEAEGLTPGLTVCAQPRRILAQQLRERVRSNRKMRYNDRTVGYMIARESSRDTSTKLLYCTEAIVALMMQARLMSTAPPHCLRIACFFPIGPLRAHCESHFSLFLHFIFGSKSGTLRLPEWLILWERMTREPA